MSKNTINRAYSFLTFKAFDDDKRTIMGTATSPTTDRMGDVIEPLGVQFKNPLPLLLYHDSRRPVGTVKFSKPTKDGVEFEAKIAKVDEPGALRDRVEEAWQSIKAQLIRAVSIGFREIEMAYNKETGGFHFLQTEVLELSLVAIPANPDATIHTIKQFDRECPPVSGGNNRDNPAGVPASTRVVKMTMTKDTKMKKTIQEQISGFEETRRAKAAERTQLMEAASDAGTTLNEEQAQQHDALTTDIKSIDDHLARLKAMEQDAVSQARQVPNAPQTPQQAEQGNRQQVYVRSQQLPPGIEFARGVMCKMASFDSMQRGEMKSSEQFAKERYPDYPRIQQFCKAAVVPALSTPADGAWAGSLVEPTNLATEFVEFLRPKTIIGRIPGLRRVPFNIRVIGQTTGGNGYWVGEGKPKPLTKFDFSPSTLGYTKVANIAVLTLEAARFSTPSLEALVRDQLAQAIIARMDTDFVDPNKAAVAGVSPASITNGITPIQSSGTDPSAVRTDFQALLAAFIDDNMSASGLVLIMPEATALALSLMVNAFGQPLYPGMTATGGTWNGLTVVASQYVTDGSPGGAIIIAANASEIFLADDGEVTVDVSREASLEMSDTPTQNGAAGTGASLVSLWQNNLIGLRAERFVNWQRRRTAAVQWLQNTDYSATGSPS